MSDAETDALLARRGRRARVEERITEAAAEIARFGRQSLAVESGQLQFDGPLLLVAAAALRRYDRLTAPRLLARYQLPAFPSVALSLRRRIERCVYASAKDLLELGSVTNPRDLPALRSALRFDGRDRTPTRSADRQAHRNLSVLVQLNLQRRLAAVDAGRSLPGTTLAAVYKIVGAGCGCSHYTVGRAWAEAVAANPALKQLQDDFRAALKGVQHSSTSEPSVDAPPRASSRDARSEAKKALDKVMSKKR